MGTGCRSFDVIDRPDREADRSRQYSAEVKNRWSYTSILPYVFRAWDRRTSPLTLSSLLWYSVFKQVKTAFPPIYNLSGVKRSEREADHSPGSSADKCVVYLNSRVRLHAVLQRWVSLRSTVTTCSIEASWSGSELSHFACHAGVSGVCRSTHLSHTECSLWMYENWISGDSTSNYQPGSWEQYYQQQTVEAKN
jgi:hypothetical protein